MNVFKLRLHIATMGTLVSGSTLGLLAVTGQTALIPAFYAQIVGLFATVDQGACLTVLSGGLCLGGGRSRRGSFQIPG